MEARVYDIDDAGTGESGKGINQGINRGIDIGEERLAKLSKELLKEKRYDALKRISEDK